MSWLSPFFYYDRTDALLAGGRVDWAATVLLWLAAFGLTALAGVAFARRDLGESLLRGRSSHARPVHAPSGNPLLATPALVVVFEQRFLLLFWVAGTALLAVFFAGLARQVVEVMQSTPGLRAQLDAMMRAGANPHEAFLGFGWFGLLQLLLALYVVTQVGRWAGEDDEGRLEMLLSAPIPRWRIVVERAAALAISCGVIALAGGLTTGAAAAALGMELDLAAAAGAAALLVPLGLAFGAVGAVFAGWKPRVAMGALAAIALLSYFAQQFGLLFGWPDWVIGLSLFHLYGAPLADGPNWSGLWTLLGVIVVGFGLAIRAMQLREVGR